MGKKDTKEANAEDVNQGRGQKKEGGVKKKEREMETKY